MTWHKIAKNSQVPDGEVKKFTIEDKTVAVANVKGNFFVVDDNCSHEQCSLSTGTLSGKELICPCHGAKFDVTTGKALTLPATVALATYKVKVDGDDIMISV